MVGRLTPELLLVGLGLALLLPVVPFTLELLALRRLTTGAFGTLMALEPAFALVIGLVVLHQVPDRLAVLGIGFVVAAGIGAERGGARPPAPADPSLVDAPAADPSLVDGSERRPVACSRLRSARIRVNKRRVGAYPRQQATGRPAAFLTRSPAGRGPRCPGAPRPRRRH